MRCRKLCIARRSGKESPHRHGPGQALRCCGHWNPAEDSSQLPFYGGAPTPAVFARGMKNSIAAGGCMAANFLRRARGEASSICFISEAAASKERWRRKQEAGQSHLNLGAGSTSHVIPSLFFKALLYRCALQAA